MAEGVSRKKSLGRWFPSASQIKVSPYDPSDPITISLFYQYISPLWSDSRKADAIKFVEKSGIECNIGGRLRIAREGINATISGPRENIDRFVVALKTFDSHFNETYFKYIDGLSNDRAFKDLRVLPVQELVYYGIDAEEQLGPGGVHLDAEEYHSKLAEPNTVVIDVRNAYESDIGRFGRQEKAGGASLLIPEMRKSTDFPAWINKEETKEQLKGKNVLMYCTGGVRCERASALLKHEYGDTIEGVFQLKGGIESYMQKFPDGGFWEGKNYVFDKREAFGVGCPEGVGGVLKRPDEPKKKKKKKSKDKVEENAELLGRCCACGVPWDRYIGKKKCSMCGVPVLLCEGCCTKKVDKATDQASLMKMRCPLCVAEDITVPAADLEITDNGVSSKLVKRGREEESGEVPVGKVARTVCKWGGGHASEKKKYRQKERQQKTHSQFNRVPCKYGKACSRADCWFSHDEVTA